MCGLQESVLLLDLFVLQGPVPLQELWFTRVCVDAGIVWSTGACAAHRMCGLQESVLLLKLFGLQGPVLLPELLVHRCLCYC